MADKYFVSPKGVAGYTWLTKADTKFNPEGVFKTDLTVSEKAAAPFIEAIKEAYVEELGTKKLAAAKLSYKTNEDGTVTFKFKTKKKPKLVDSKGLPITKDINVGAGSELKIKGALNAYNTGANHGVSLYINEVMVVKLVEFGGGASGGWGDAEEGGFEFKDDGTEAEAPAPTVHNDAEDF